MKKKVTFLTVSILFLAGLCITPSVLAGCMDECHQFCGTNYPNNFDQYNACMKGCGKWCPNPPV